MKKATLLLVIWNVLLSAVLGWSLMRSRGAGSSAEPMENEPAMDTVVASSRMSTDTAALKNARIAFFFMDSIQGGYEMVKESASRVKKEGQRLEGDLAREMQKAQAKYQELMNKDHRYSTQAETDADEKTLQDLQDQITEMRSRSQSHMDELQMKLLQDITVEIQDFLGEYNKAAGFDYIFSIQDGGQIWVGNKGLDITADVLAGLNARHRAKKTGK